MKNLISKLTLVILGFIAGLIVMGVLAKRASTTYLEIFRSNYQLEQENLAKQAISDNDPLVAVVHYKNLVDSSNITGTKAFNDTISAWDLGFPFAAPILAKIKQESDPTHRGAKKLEGINHGRLAVALEKLGYNQKATLEWEKTKELLGIKSTERARTVIGWQ